MNEEETALAQELYAAIQAYTTGDARSQQAREFKVGISDLGWCSERLRRMLGQENPDDTDMLPAFIGTAIGDHLERAVAQAWPEVLIQPKVTLELRDDNGHVFAIPGRPDIVHPGRGLVLDGKGLSLDTLLPTPTGWTTMGAVQPGDQVFDRDGRPTTVTFKSGVRRLDCYRVEFRNGISVVCDADHLWVVLVNGAEQVWGMDRVIDRKVARKPLSVPIADELSLLGCELPIDPWVLGYWLGNGTRSNGAITCHGDDRSEIADLVRSAGWKIIWRLNSRGANAATGVVQDASEPHPRDPISGRLVRGDGLRKRLADLGLLGDKHIPPEYLRGSRAQRMALLRGLMDSDGTWNKSRRRVSFSSVNQALARQVGELARTLGQRVCISHTTPTGFGKTVDCWTVEWSPTFNPFACSRKADRVEIGKAKVHQHRVVRVEPVRSVPTQCIAVDSATQTYLCTEAMIPTHNTARGLSVVSRTGFTERQKRFQRHGYAKAAHAAGLFGDLDLAEVSVGNVWIDRAADDRELLVRLEPYDETVIDEMTDWLGEVIYNFTHGQEAPKEPPREVCAATCSFFDPCRAYDTDVAGLLTAENVVAAMEQYREGLELERTGAKLKDQAKAELRGYTGFALLDGERWSLRWVTVNETIVPETIRKGYDKLDLRKLK